MWGPLTLQSVWGSQHILHSSGSAALSLNKTQQIDDVIILQSFWQWTVWPRIKNVSNKKTNGRAPDPQISSEQAYGWMLHTHTYSDDDNNNNNNNIENNNNENNDKWQTTWSSDKIWAGLWRDVLHSYLMIPQSRFLNVEVWMKIWNVKKE